VNSADHGWPWPPPFAVIPAIRWSAAGRKRSTTCKYRVEKDYFAPAMAELLAAGVTQARPICRDYACRHEGATLDLTTLPPKQRTHTLRKRLVCRRCGLRRPELDLIWVGQ
jgi:hypothetical protein